jgi:PadR family transcriptional regulator AphA
MHGYEMMCFLGDEGLDAVCPVEQSTLYTYLRNVETRHLVTWTEERVGLRPPRKTYALSPQGREIIEDWLRRPVERMREVRLEFLLKLFFLNLTDYAAMKILLAQQISVCEDYLAHVQAARAESPFRRLVAHSKSSAAEATLGWLKTYAYEIEHEVGQ